MFKYLVKIQGYLRNQTIRKKLIVSTITTVCFILLFWGATTPELHSNLEKKQKANLLHGVKQVLDQHTKPQPVNAPQKQYVLF